MSDGAFLDRSKNLRALLALDRTLGILCSAVGLLLLVAWWTGRATDRHGMIFVFIGALWIGPAGPLFLLAGRAWHRGWRTRWLLQVLPLLYPFLFTGLLKLAFK